MGTQPRSLRARAAGVPGARLVALVAIAVLLMAGEAGFVNAGGQGVLAGSTGDIHVGSGG